ncbi:unnamed protein product [Tilletia controversa]|uniref:Uncharacterized protein n=1 Tax=Tilletia controversa TaxID=13291 RepID=A0A8X7SZI0_9BASI|nr:hypothetical protein A4X06_0g2069 [Tilletia controversa]CAD6951904.1 unnamed protein product [Tilletia controversa]CAD6972483.1 unnamed protein product [Tilletia controversa]CAD6975934.1 unnamed protein product [Tilletia controversa]
MRFVLAAATILGFVSAAAAIDNRRLVQFTGKSSTFCSRWNTACKNYTPKDTSLVYRNAYCNLGDYSGAHTDSQAKVFCSFVKKTSPDGPSTTVTKHIASEVGAKFL